MPPSVKGGVILDATASCNVVYDLFNGATVIQPPPDTRRYNNVNLLTSCGHKVGKGDMKNNAKELSEALIADLDNRFSAEDGTRKVLIVTHNAVEPFMIQCTPQKFTVAVAHWGAVDGSNEWQNFDTVVIFGLPYKPRRWSASLFMAYQGVQDTLWLHDPDRRKFKQHEDIRRAIEVGQMVSEIIQAVNRVHCRRVSDEAGNCPPTDVFILLPPLTEAEGLLKGIAGEMPGINVLDWNYSHQKQGRRGRRVNRGNFDESLVAYLQSLNPGDKEAASRVKNTLAIPETTWTRIASRLRGKALDDSLCSELQSMGIDYHVEKGKAHFIKVAA